MWYFLGWFVWWLVICLMWLRWGFSFSWMVIGIWCMLLRGWWVRKGWGVWWMGWGWGWGGRWWVVCLFGWCMRSWLDGWRGVGWRRMGLGEGRRRWGSYRRYRDELCLCVMIFVYIFGFYVYVMDGWGMYCIILMENWGYVWWMLKDKIKVVLWYLIFLCSYVLELEGFGIYMRINKIILICKEYV